MRPRCGEVALDVRGEGRIAGLITRGDEHARRLAELLPNGRDDLLRGCLQPGDIGLNPRLGEDEQGRAVLVRKRRCVGAANEEMVVGARFEESGNGPRRRGGHDW